MKKQRNKNKKTFIYIGGIVVLLLVSFILSNKAKNDEQQAIEDLFDKEIILDVQDFADQGADHIPDPGQFEYNSNPPTSGPHYGQAPAWGFYPEPMEDELAIHAIEHGGVWISYKDLNEDEIDLLKDFAKNNSKSVIITPRDKNESRISAVAWTKLTQFESVDVDALQKFLLLNKNKTHEPLAA